MNPAYTSDRNLLLGILALQNGLIEEPQLIGAIKEWAFDKQKSLGEILVSNSTMPADVRLRLEQMVDLHIGLHGDEVEKSLQVLSSVDDLAATLLGISDDDVQASVGHVVTLNRASVSSPFSSRRSGSAPDEVLDRFERAWQAGTPSKIEVVLGGVDTGKHAELLEDLLCIELWWRAQAGEQPARAEYHQRFPEAIHVVDAAFDEFQVSNATIAPSSSQSSGSVGVSTLSGTRFRILRPHARGGLGEVFVAQDEELNRQVALKEILPGKAGHEEVRNRFLLEAEVTGGLEHPGIVPVYGLGQYEDGRPYYAMRFIRGDSLKDAIKAFHENKDFNESERSLQLRKLLGRFVDVCQAISYAHSRGVLHRDLKPGNIMLGKYGETLVVDWGLAKVDGREEATRTDDEHTLMPSSGSGVTPTLMGSAIGTPAYMPPEQAAGRLDELGPASDVYSLGATLFHLLTGASPFAGKDLMTILKDVQEANFTPPRVVNSNIPKPIEAVCLKAMSAKPKDRYISPTELANDVERFLADEPVTAITEPLSVKAKRWIKHHQVLCATTTAVVFMTLAGIGVFQKYETHRQAGIALKQTELTNKANAARTEAEKESQRADIAAKRAMESESKVKFQLAQSNYFLAASRAEDGRIAEAHRLLDNVPKTYRNFEWFLDKRMLEGGDLTCYGHTSSVGAVRFSPNGKTLASGGKTIRFWDASTGAELHRIDDVSGSIFELAFSPSGNRIAAACSDNIVRIWEVETGKLLTRMMGHTKSVYSVSFSHDGAFLASGSHDNLVIVWDAKSGESVKVFRGHRLGQHAAEFGLVSSVHFLSDGRIGSGSWNGSVKLWDWKSDAAERVLRGAGMISRISIDATEKHIALSTSKRQLQVFGMDGEKKWEAAEYSGAVFSPDGLRIVAASKNSIAILDARTGQEQDRFRGHWDSVTDLCFSPDGRRVASASADQTVKIWSLDSPDGRTIPRSSVRTIRVGTDGEVFSTGSVLMVTNPYTGVEKFNAGSDTDAWGFAVRKDGNTIVCGDFRATYGALTPLGRDENGVFKVQQGKSSIDSSVWLHDRLTGQKRRLGKHEDRVKSIEITPNGRWAISGSDDGSIKVWDLQSVKPDQSPRNLPGHTDGVNSVAISPDGTRVASGGNDKTLRICDFATGNQLMKVEHTSRVDQVIYSPSGDFLVSSSDGIRIWNSENGKLVRVLSSRGGCVTFSPDGSRIVSGGPFRSIKVWDSTTGQELRTLEGDVSALCFSSDGQTLVTGSSRQLMKLWRAPQQSEVQALWPTSGPVTTAVFGPDGKRVYGESGGQKLIWDTESSALLEGAEWKPPTNASNITKDGRWMVIPVGEAVLLVDRDYKITPDEAAHRHAKAAPQFWWHRAQSEKSHNEQLWFASAFHAANALRLEPDSRSQYEILVASYTKLNDQQRQLLPTFVAQVRQQPIPQVPTYSESEAKNVNRRVWEKVAPASSSEDSNELDLEWIRAVVRDFPRGVYFNTLGVAEYRSGNYQAAIDACLKSVELTPKEMDLAGPHPSDLACLAMSHFRLDDKEQANSYRQQLTEAMTLEVFKTDSECLGFVKEVDSLLDAENSNSSSPQTPGDNGEK